MSGFRRILVPHDFSPHADHALRVAVRMAGPNGTIVVLHVVAPYVPVGDMPLSGLAPYVSPEELAHGARRRLERSAARLRTRGHTRVIVRVAIGDPYRCIVAASRGMDAIVMSTAGRTGLSHLVIGSVAEKVVRHSPIPVLTLRPRVAARAATARWRRAA
jgi:nucleotide-binding universal stress UspA family protein